MRQALNIPRNSRSLARAISTTVSTHIRVPKSIGITNRATGIDHAENPKSAHKRANCLSLTYDARGLVDEAYKNGSGSEHGIYQTYKLALYLYALQATGTYYYGEEDNLFRLGGS